MNKDLNNIIEINLKDMFMAVLRRCWLIILIGIIFAAGAGYYSKNYMIPVYKSSAKLYMINSEDGQITTLADLQIGSYLMKDYAILVKSRPVADEVIRRLNLSISASGLINLISVFAPEDSRVLQITVTYYDQYLVKEMVDTIAQVSSERMVDIMGMEQVNIVEDGVVPQYPFSPDVKHYVVLAGCGGVLLGTVIIVLLFLLNDSIKTAEDIEKYLGLTTLGFIPVENIQKKKKQKESEKSKKVA